MSIPPCGNPEFYLTLVSLLGGLNIPAARVAAAYVETQLAPVKTEMANQVDGIAVVLVLILFFFIIIPLFVYIVWICYELQTSVTTAIVMIVLFFIVSLAIVYFVATSVGTTINGVLNTATSQLISLDNPNTVTTLETSINTAASQYLAAIGITCS